MLSEIAKSAFEFLKLAPRYLISVALIAGALLFSPDSWLQQLGLNAFADSNRQWLGLLFLISAVLWAVSIVVACWEWLVKRFSSRRIRKRIIEKLHGLTEDEKQILRFYYAKETHANTLRVDDGVVQELVAEGVIYRSASMGSAIEGFAHNISDLAWSYIHKKPYLLEGTTNTYRTDKRWSF